MVALIPSLPTAFLAFTTGLALTKPLMIFETFTSIPSLEIIFPAYAGIQNTSINLWSLKLTGHHLTPMRWNQNSLLCHIFLLFTWVE